MARERGELGLELGSRTGRMLEIGPRGRSVDRGQQAIARRGRETWIEAEITARLTEKVGELKHHMAVGAMNNFYDTVMDIEDIVRDADRVCDDRTFKMISQYADNLMMDAAHDQNGFFMAMSGRLSEIAQRRLREEGDDKAKGFKRAVAWIRGDG